MAIRTGETWNESSWREDPVTLRRVLRVTRFGQYNQTPTYHINTAFSRDGRYLVLASGRGDRSYILRADTATGDLTALYGAEGTGSRDYMHASDGAELGNGRGVCGNRLALAPGSGWAVFTRETSLLAVNIFTGELKTLVADIGEEWIFGAPCVSWDEAGVAVPLSTAHPQLLRGERMDRSYLSYPDHRLKMLWVSLEDGAQKALFELPRCQSSHAAFCPSDPDLLLFDRNVPPGYWCGNDGGKTPRLWLHRISTGETRPLRTEYPGVFQVHSAWTWDGGAVAYHGFLRPEGYGSGIFIGLTARDGTPVRDYVFAGISAYGHVSTDPARPALILDGDVLPGYLSRLYYDGEKPQLEVICRHGTQWDGLPGQYSHPHPQCDPSGRLICFNRAENGRSDVYIVSE